MTNAVVDDIGISENVIQPNGAQGWQDELKLKANLLMKDIAAFEQVYFSMPALPLALTYQRSVTRFANVLKAGIEAGWIIEPETETGTFGKSKRYFYKGVDVDEMHAGMVRWLGYEIDQAYTAALEPPPN